MAEASGEGGELPFEPEGDFYSMDALGATVLWPLVDDLRRFDWRTESDVHSEFNLPRTALHNGEFISVTLEADHSVYTLHGEKPALPDGDEPKYKQCTLALSVEKPVSDEARPLVLSLAMAAMAETYGSEEDVEEEEGGDGSDDGLVLRNGISFVVSDDGRSGFGVYRLIDDEDGDEPLTLPLHSMEDNNMDEELRAHDLDIVESACHVLGASDAVLEALGDFRDNPLTWSELADLEYED